MTELELASLDAFNDLVTHGGRTFTVGIESVQGLCNYIEPEDAQYTLEDGEQQDAIVKVKISDWPSGKNRKGTVFVDEFDNSFRIKTARKAPLFWVFRCDVS